MIAMPSTSSCTSLPLGSKPTPGKQTSARSSARVSLELLQPSRIPRASLTDQSSWSRSLHAPKGSLTSPSTTPQGRVLQPKMTTSANVADKARPPNTTSNSSHGPTSSTTSHQRTRLAQINVLDTTTSNPNARSLKRKPSIIKNFVSDQRAVAKLNISGVRDSANPEGHGPYRDCPSSQAMLAPVAGEQQSSAAVPRSSQDILFDNHSRLSLLHARQSPAFYSEASGTPSLRQSASPVSVFTHATAMSSRTSRSSGSPLYAASPNSNVGARSSSALARTHSKRGYPVRLPTVMDPRTVDKPRQYSSSCEDDIPGNSVHLTESAANVLSRPHGSALARSSDGDSKHHAPSKVQSSQGPISNIKPPPELAHLLDRPREVSRGLFENTHSGLARTSETKESTNTVNAPYMPLSDCIPDTVGDARVTSPKDLSQSQPKPDVRLSSDPSRASLSDRHVHVLSEPRITSPLTPSPPLEARPDRSKQRIKPPRPSFGFSRPRANDSTIIPEVAIVEPTKGFVRSKLHALFHHCGKGHTARQVITNPSNPSKTSLKNSKAVKKDVPQNVQLDPFLSSRLDPIWLRGSTQANRPRHNTGDRNDHHDPDNSISKVTSTEIRSYAEGVSRDNENPHDNHKHWLRFPKPCQDTSVQKRSFVQRAISLASKKHPPVEVEAVVPNVQNPRSTIQEGIASIMSHVPGSQTPNSGKRMSDGEHILRESPSKKVLTEEQFMENAKRNGSRVNGDLSKSVLIPTNHMLGRSPEAVSCQYTKGAKLPPDTFGEGTINCNFSPDVLLDAQPNDQKRHLTSNALDPLAMNPRTPQPHRSTLHVKTSTRSDKIEGQERLVLKKIAHLPSITGSTSFPAADTQSRSMANATGNIECVVENELLKFGQSRDSASSYASSSKTLHFPAVPTHPPLMSLPQIPDHARGSEAKAQMLTSTKVPACAETIEISRGKANSYPVSVAPIKSAKFESLSCRTVDERKDGTAGKEAPNISNLRFASLMTSKWLSFGRVMLSSVVPGDKILVIDGLGRDWSYYCALTYPRAKIYTLTSDTLLQSQSLKVNGLHSPPNHKDIFYPDASAKFPFADNFFTTTIFRFPVTATNTALHHTLTECTRVLQPGGYMEVSALDLDLANMGSRARRAVRDLKIKIHASGPELCLMPVSDNIQTLLGQCGFKKLSRCIIGIPAAGPVTDSRKSMDEQSRSFGELMTDESEHSDGGIAKMVSKVGRWWYGQCYESGNISQSIWCDEVLLKECEQLHTAFKLLICYAQKASENHQSPSSSCEN